MAEKLGRPADIANSSRFPHTMIQTPAPRTVNQGGDSQIINQETHEHQKWGSGSGSAAPLHLKLSIIN